MPSYLRTARLGGRSIRRVLNIFLFYDTINILIYLNINEIIVRTNFLSVLNIGQVGVWVQKSENTLWGDIFEKHTKSQPNNYITAREAFFSEKFSISDILFLFILTGISLIRSFSLKFNFFVSINLHRDYFDKVEVGFFCGDNDGKSFCQSGRFSFIL